MNVLTLNCTVLYVLYVCTFTIYYVCLLVSGNMVAAEMLTGLVSVSAREETSIFSVLLKPIYCQLNCIGNATREIEVLLRHLFALGMGHAIHQISKSSQVQSTFDNSQTNSLHDGADYHSNTGGIARIIEGISLIQIPHYMPTNRNDAMKGKTVAHLDIFFEVILG